MPFYQCDSSGLVKRYVDEVGSDWVRAMVDPASANIISIADITRAEISSALARRAREGVISLNERDELIQTFRAHCVTQYRIVPTQPQIAVTAENPNLRRRASQRSRTPSTPLYGRSRGRPHHALLAQDRFSHAL
jgi:predicted nucleic acid-binding protein